VWGKVENLGRGTKANYDPERKMLTFCFDRNPQMSGDALKALRGLLISELKDLGYDGRMKYNGEVVVEGIAEEDVVLVKKNHKLLIHLNKKNVGKKEESSSDPET
jgi:hypothetical protein